MRMRKQNARRQRAKRQSARRPYAKHKSKAPLNQGRVILNHLHLVRTLILFLLVNPVHLDLYVRKARFRQPYIDGSPPDVGGIPVKTAMDANADTRNTGFPSMFSGTGAAATEQATASTDQRKFGTADPWADYRKKSAQYNFSDDPLFKGSFNQDAKQNKVDRKEDGPASQVRTPQEQDLGEIIKRALLEGFKGAKGKDQDKPKAKEADKIDLPEFPSPDRYRTWRAAVREAIRSASDDPDAAFAWVLEVYAVREDKAKLCSELADPGKFRTL